MASSGLRAQARRKRFWGVVFITPAFLFAAAFMIYPLFYSLYISFTRYNFAWDAGPVWTGLDNYVKAFRTKAFIDSMLTTARFSIVFFVAVMVFGLLLALLLFYARRRTGFFRTAFFLPIVVPLSLSSYVFKWILQQNYGLVNYFLASVLGLAGLQQQWITSMPWALYSCVIVSVWSAVGFETILFLNGLQALSGDMLEAGVVDGATGFRTLFLIILPNLRETFVITGIWAILQALKVFVVPTVLTTGGPGTSTFVMYMYVYREAFTYFEMGYGAACGFILSVVILIFSLLNLRLSRSES